MYAEPHRVERLGKWSQFSKVIKIRWRLLSRCLFMSCHCHGQRLYLVTPKTGISTSILTEILAPDCTGMKVVRCVPFESGYLKESD